MKRERRDVSNMGSGKGHKGKPNHARKLSKDSGLRKPYDLPAEPFTTYPAPDIPAEVRAWQSLERHRGEGLRSIYRRERAKREGVMPHEAERSRMELPVSELHPKSQRHEVRRGAEQDGAPRPACWWQTKPTTGGGMSDEMNNRIQAIVRRMDEARRRYMDRPSDVDAKRAYDAALRELNELANQPVASDHPEERIAPALTAQEWRDGYIGIDVEVHLKTPGLSTVGPRVHVEVKGYPLGGSMGDVRDLHALAALCLYGQPFGFTREDVRVLERVSRNLLSNPEFDPQTGNPYHAKGYHLASIASRIAALLPPPDPEQPK